MWRPFLKKSISSAFYRSNFTAVSNNRLCGCLFSTSVNGGDRASAVRLEDVDALKVKLGAGGNEVVRYCELLQACQSLGVAKSADDAKRIAKVLDDAGDVFVFSDKVHLHPQKVMEMVRRAIPLALMPEDDPEKDELKKLQAKQDEIDVIAHKQVRCILWTGLGLLLAQASLFFRLTFWEFSWDVMEPITFFTASSGLLIGYAYFLFTSRDPSYRDLMQRLFLSRRRKLMKKHGFDVERFMELQKKCLSSSEDCRGGAGKLGSFS